MMESGSAADLEEIGRVMLFRRLFQLAEKNELVRSIPEYHEYRKLLELWHQGKI